MAIEIQFTVTAYTRAINSFVSVDEGSSVNISCNSSGVPTPSVTWERNNQPLMLVPTERVVDQVPQLSNNILFDIMLGSILSSIEVVDAQYLGDDGVYTCIGTNDYANGSSSEIHVQVVGMPMLVVMMLMHFVIHVFFT